MRTNIIQQKGRPLLTHLQPAVAKKLVKLKKKRHIWKATNNDENGLVSPAVIFVKKDQRVKIVSNSRIFNGTTVERKAEIPNMEQLMSRISRKIADKAADDFCFSKFDLDYAYGYLPKSKKRNGPMPSRNHRR